jgi:hypothetical protein
MTTDCPTQTAATPATKPARAKKAPLMFRRTCAECGTKFETPHCGKEFCCEAHRVAFANRCAARGKVLLPLALGWRVTRGRKGSVGAQAMEKMIQLLDKFAAEDRAAKRPSMDGYVDRLLNGSVHLRWDER